jgi:hypothetical protein
MQTYTALYRDQSLLPFDMPFAFQCQADDTDHAEEQCMDAYPDAEILWLVQTDNVDAALLDYWGTDAN